MNHITTALTHVLASGGIISTATTFNASFLALVKNAGLTVLVLAFLVTALRRGWAMGALIGGLFIAGIAYFAMNGGLELVGTLIKQQFS